MNTTATTATPAIQVPDAIGAPFEGGFYGGKIRIGIAIFAIVWAPKAEGEIKGCWLDSYTDVPGATSCFDSMANTQAMALPAAAMAQQALAANIGGLTDWCIPARDVLEMGYRYLKPTTQKNYCSFRDGDNASSIPPGYPYTEANPVQTPVEAFQVGNAEAFETDGYYWSSTQSSENYAFIQYFSYGIQYNGNSKYYQRRCRFVRLIPLNPSIL
jgi:hypothetical protein